MLHRRKVDIARRLAARALDLEPWVAAIGRLVDDGSIENSSSKDHGLRDVGNRAVNSSWRKLYPHIIDHTARHIVLGSPMNLRAKASRSRSLESSLWTRTRFRAMRGAV
jgi:hypothetical protein